MNRDRMAVNLSRPDVLGSINIRETYIVRWIGNGFETDVWDIWYRGTRGFAAYCGTYHGPLEQWIDAANNREPSAAVTIVSR